MSRFFSKLKGDKDHRPDLTPSETSSSTTFGSNNPYRYTQSQPPEYQPPAGQPPPQSKDEYVPATSGQHEDTPPPYHDWTSIPDTALLPPPPPVTSEYSSTTNASYDEAAAAHDWCASHPVYKPQVAHTSVIEGVTAGKHTLIYPPNAAQRGWRIQHLPKPASTTFTNPLNALPSSILHLLSPSSPTTSIAPPKPSLSRLFNKSASASQPSLQDLCFTSQTPLYLASTSNPLSPNFVLPKPAPYTIYFEITPLHFHSPSATVSLGFVALPYPTTRQPGWHRASLAVHSDDGNRYVNDSWGGREFTSPFREGETVGIGMQVFPEEIEMVGKQGNRVLQSEREVRSDLPKCRTKVFFVRRGQEAGIWEVAEERDAERDEGVAGLMGEVDLYAAVGVFGDVDVEVRFFRVGEDVVVPMGMGMAT